MSVRFAGSEGRRRLIDVLQEQFVLRRCPAAVEALAGAVRVQEYSPGDVLIRQDGDEDDVAFLLDGKVEVTVNGKTVAERGRCEHIGEMSAIDPPCRRSATVRAVKPTIAAWICEPELSRIAAAHPSLWRAFAKVLAERLRQRERFHPPANPVPRVFLASSSEAIDVLEAMRECLAAAPEVELVLWNDGAFRPGHYHLEDLEAHAARADFAVLIVQGDDEVRSRGETSAAPRDNMIFELGLFVGALGRRRALVLAPSPLVLKLPSDYFGVTLVQYRRDENGVPDVRGACEELLRYVGELGAR